MANAHLTFPHDAFNHRMLRIQQINETLRLIQGFKESSNVLNTSCILCGDFNDSYDDVHDRILQDGFKSVFS